MLLVGMTCSVKTEKWPLGFTVWGRVGDCVCGEAFTVNFNEKSFFANI